MTRMRVCSVPGCPTLHPATGRCPACRRTADQARRPHGNPYATKGHQQFREQVLALHPYCVCPGTCQGHQGACGSPSTVADHYPHERRDLIEMGLNPNDPNFGRGLCKTCHDRWTARTNPAGWNAQS